MECGSGCRGFSFDEQPEFLFVWNPAHDELARYDPDQDLWEQIPGPGLTVFPAKMLAEGDRLLVFGTGWPSSWVPTNNDLVGAELVEGEWIAFDPVDFETPAYANVADPGTASFAGGAVVVWGDPSQEPGPTRILEPDLTWSTAPPPLDEYMLHPRPIILDNGRILALAEGDAAAIWEPDNRRWHAIDPPPMMLSNEAVWTGTEIIAFKTGEVWRWTPPST